MRKLKKSILVIILTILLSIQTNIYGYEIEEDTDYIWLNEEISNVSTDPIKEPKINSRYAIVLDRDSKESLYSKDSDKRVPMASTTKIMTSIVLLENLGVNNDLTLNSQIEVCKQAGAIGGSRLGLKAGDKITINDLLYGLMLCSGNDDAVT